MYNKVRFRPSAVADTTRRDSDIVKPNPPTSHIPNGGAASADCFRHLHATNLQPSHTLHSDRCSVTIPNLDSPDAQPLQSRLVFVGETVKHYHSTLSIQKNDQIVLKADPPPASIPASAISHVKGSVHTASATAPSTPIHPVQPWHRNALDIFAGDADSYMQSSLELHSAGSPSRHIRGSSVLQPSPNAFHNQQSGAGAASVDLVSTSALWSSSDAGTTSIGTSIDDDLYEDVEDVAASCTRRKSLPYRRQSGAASSTGLGRPHGSIRRVFSNNGGQRQPRRSRVRSNTNSNNSSMQLRPDSDGQSVAAAAMQQAIYAKASTDMSSVPQSPLRPPWLSPDRCGLDPYAYQELMDICHHYSNLTAQLDKRQSLLIEQQQQHHQGLLNLNNNDQNCLDTLEAYSHEMEPLTMPDQMLTVHDNIQDIAGLTTELQASLSTGHMPSAENLQMLSRVRGNISALGETLDRLERVLQHFMIAEETQVLCHETSSLNTAGGDAQTVPSLGEDSNLVSAKALLAVGSRRRRRSFSALENTGTSTDISRLGDTVLNAPVRLEVVHSLASDMDRATTDVGEEQGPIQTIDKDLPSCTTNRVDSPLNPSNDNDRIQTTPLTRPSDPSPLSILIENSNTRALMPMDTIGDFISDYSYAVGRLEEPHLVEQRAAIKSRKSAQVKATLPAFNRPSMSNLMQRTRPKRGLLAKGKHTFLVQESSKMADKESIDSTESMEMESRSPRVSVSDPNLAHTSRYQDSLFSRPSLSVDDLISLDDDDPLKVYESPPVRTKPGALLPKIHLAKFVKAVSLATKRSFSKDKSLPPTSTERFSMSEPRKVSPAQRSRDFDDLEEMLNRLDKMDRPDNQSYVRNSLSINPAGILQGTEELGSSTLVGSVGSAVFKSKLALQAINPALAPNLSTTLPVAPAAEYVVRGMRQATPMLLQQQQMGEPDTLAGDSSFDELERALDRMSRLTRMNNQSFVPVTSNVESSTLYETSSGVSISPYLQQTHDDYTEGSTLRDPAESSTDADVTSTHSDELRHQHAHSEGEEDSAASSQLSLHRAVLAHGSGDPDGNVGTARSSPLQRLLQHHQQYPLQSRSSSLSPNTIRATGSRRQESDLRGGAPVAVRTLQDPSMSCSRMPEKHMGTVLNGIEEEDVWYYVTDMQASPADMGGEGVSDVLHGAPTSGEGESVETALSADAVLSLHHLSTSNSTGNSVSNSTSNSGRSNNSNVGSVDQSATIIPGEVAQAEITRVPKIHQRQVAIYKPDSRYSRKETNRNNQGRCSVDDSMGSEVSHRRHYSDVSRRRHYSDEEDDGFDDDEEDDVYWQQQQPELTERDQHSLSSTTTQPQTGRLSHRRAMSSWGDEEDLGSVHSHSRRLSAAELDVFGRQQLNVSFQADHTHQQASLTTTPQNQRLTRVIRGDAISHRDRYVPRGNVVVASALFDEGSLLHSTQQQQQQQPYRYHQRAFSSGVAARIGSSNRNVRRF
ncbi:hypothetical protein BASA50_008981 [Batrachochytrium salamandrivorans]|uniref:Uncharacterized protein n=1 Tax=Batrachochytrium salamandrivorans TaxID=1357716 RepID=A0ABQ8F5P8_9FUNG|nr:hypothetical protein BASA50_008981 [Batrachochytrium salamandrivorans]KAH9268582.1 hypothetical protein BASA84_000187 [Batrachochytrium salamandrivorans]KAJ1343275.1 hypothetical protein BSLG_002301 [Batrachochytrium salamandrivorans]